MLKKFRSSRKHKNDVEVHVIDPSSLPTTAGRKTSTASEATGSELSPKKRNSHIKDNLSADLQRLGLSPNTSYRGLSPSPDRGSQSLGLHVVHEPSPTAPVDIIFVHGLGGDSRKTWSRNHNAEFFWPALWLPLEPDICNARILSFGYNASFRAGAPKNVSNIADFSKELLFEMAFGKDDDGHDLNLGRVPIIFIVHSMGGLVVKKAYILGQNDEEYQNIVRSISAIIFLATPHRGTELAEILNRILKVSFQSPQNFIADLNKSSPALEDLNEQFRHIAPRLSIFSFYETLATAVGPKKIMVLEKDSSILGYSKEVSRALNADHHNVCKFSTPQDSNYVIVRNALKTLVCRLQNKGSDILGSRLAHDDEEVKSLFGITSGPEEDLIEFRRWWIPGTCEWVLDEPPIRLWLDEAPGPRVIWFTAPPASGKSILSTYIISHLRVSGISCQYFFFRFGNQNKRSLSAFLRSVAYQIAQDNPEFKRILMALSTEGLKLKNADTSFIWHKIFESILFEMELRQPLFWIIDALDEAESPKALIELLKSLTGSKTEVRLLIISRKTESMMLAFDRLSGTVPVHLVEKDGRDHNSEDIQLLVEKEMKHMRGSDRLKQEIKETIIHRASGNFLWVRLVLEEILSCHTEEAIQETLDEIPSDMSRLYQRMETTILTNPRKSNRVLAKALFNWVIFASRSLTLLEISQALKPEYPDFIDLRRTVQDVCGQFLIVDRADHVGMVHQTARDYLIHTSNNELAISIKDAHTQLFKKCTQVLLDPKLRIKLTHSKQALRSTEPFLFYAATSWTYHLRHTPTTSDDAFDILAKLFSGPFVLTWIHSLALVNRLEVLVKAAKALTTFVNARRKLNAARNPLLHRISDLELLNLWTIDLVKIVAKFSKHILFDALAIYKLVPPFCPRNSAIHQQFHESTSTTVSISGVLNDYWNDNLARINLPKGDRGWQIICAGRHVGVLGASGSIFVWNSSNFAAICTLRHREPVTAICFNNKGDKIATYGLRSTKLWEIPSGKLLSSTPNPVDSKAMAIVFAEGDSKIIVAGDDKAIRYIHTGKFDAGWQVFDVASLKETSDVEGMVVNSPMGMAFNGDATQVGVCYRGSPLSVWSLPELRCIGRCRRAKKLRKDNARPSTSWFAVDRFTWNPISGHVIGIYKDGCIFKWHPLTDENQEAQTTADEVAASPDGKLFASSSSNGTVKVWSFAYFSVIYQLSSADLVTGLAFSPDCRRFYDLRGSSVNAWESNSLIRFSETEESFSDTASEEQSPSSVSHVSEACLAEFEAVSALATSPSSFLYCFGKEDGTVNLVDARTGRCVELMKFLNFLSVTQIVWGNDGRYIAAADLGGDIMIKRLELPSPEEDTGVIHVGHFPNPKINTEGRAIHQILLNHNSTLLLIVTEDKGQIWGINEAALMISVPLENGTLRNWINHPSDNEMLLGFGVNDAVSFSWDGFMKQNVLRYQEDRSRMDSTTSIPQFNREDDNALGMERLSISSNDDHEFESSVNKVIVTQDDKHVLLQIRNMSSHGRISQRCLVFDVSTLDCNGDQALIYTSIQPEISGIIEVPLGILSGSRFTFLDQDLWCCTCKLGTLNDEETLIRHYFIPRDWASTDGLERCCMRKDGTLLCPKDGEVAVIMSTLELECF